MPSPHHHHHGHATQCCCCSCCCSSPSSSPSPPPLAASDQLLQLLADRLLLQQSPPPPHLTPHQYPKPRYPHPHRTHQHNDQQQQIHSLLRRVAALESSFPHLSSAHPPPSRSPPPPSPPPPPPPPPPVSLRDVAARTIQARFRRFLVGRSQTLRHLKQLAAVKSHVAALKSSLSDKTHLAPDALSERAMDLLLELDSIKSGDPMIREGRRSISRELARILEFVDKVLVKEQQLYLGAMEIAASGSNRTIKPAKRVSFAENGEDSTASEYSTGDRWVPQPRLSKELKEIKGFSRVFEEDGEEDHLGPEGWKVSDDEKSPKGVAEDGVRYGIGEYLQGQNGNLGLFAPLPVQMEPRKEHSRKNVVLSPN